MNRPLATISLDLDNQWAYLKNDGAPGWEKYPSYLDVFVPYVLELLRELGLKITFFVVAKDAELSQSRDSILRIADEGHEIANHSFHHDTFLHQYSKEQLQAELDHSHRVLSDVAGKAPVGFRGPGFTTNIRLLEELIKRGYRYDSSSFPTFAGPLIRAYYFRMAKLTSEERKKRKGLFGKFSDGFKSLKPHFSKLSDQSEILEMPVTTFPVIRLPIHLSYLMYLCLFSPSLALFYLRSALFFCSLFKVPPNFLVHPTDLMGSDRLRGMEFFPGMQIPTDQKRRVFIRVVELIGKRFKLVPMKEKSEEIYAKYNQQLGKDIVHP